jgi:hypothetical protein
VSFPVLRGAKAARALVEINDAAAAQSVRTEANQTLDVPYARRSFTGRFSAHFRSLRLMEQMPVCM